jgi:DNA-directed RNA polymerase subunit RPC12/RpoP
MSVDAREYYLKEDVRQAIVLHAKDREVGVRYGEAFGSRPDMITYPNDVVEFAKKSASSFHISEERWHNPLDLKAGMRKQEMDTLRSGWDFIIDVDCPIWEYSKIITHLLVVGLKEHGIKSVTVKFSGNKGFHIGVPFEAFPEEFQSKPIASLFPEAPRRMAEYLVHFINSEKMDYALSKMILKTGSLQQISEIVGKPKEELMKFICPKCKHDRKTNTMSLTYLCPNCTTQVNTETEKDFVRCPKCSVLMQEVRMGKRECTSCGSFDDPMPIFNPEPILEVDTVLISSRHLYRMPYSLHEKSGLVSIPFDSTSILSFEKHSAKPEKVDTTRVFLDASLTKAGEASALLEATYAFLPPEEKESQEQQFVVPEKGLPAEMFPPCIQKIVAGISDGRKRALFTLDNFFASIGYTPEERHTLLKEWNDKNPEPLPEYMVRSHIEYHKRRVMMPQNCASSIYKELNVCTPDHMCKMIKNPVQYAKRKNTLSEQTKGKKKEKKVLEVKS